MSLSIRKVVSYRESTMVEGKAFDTPWVMAAAAAVVQNPWAGQFVEDLTPAIMEIAPDLGQILTDEICSLLGGAEQIEAYGKAAIVGLDGEIEHASALIHTLHFGNIYRQAVQGKSYLAFSNTRGPANAPIVVPMMDINDVGRRSHYLSLQFNIADAPKADEVVVVLGAANAGRPFHRIGDRYQDLKQLGHDHENPAGVS